MRCIPEQSAKDILSIEAKAIDRQGKTAKDKRQKQKDLHTK